MNDDKDKRTIAQWQEHIHWLARSKGWWDEKSEQEQRVERELAVIAMTHMEPSAVLEKVRVGGVLSFGDIDMKEAVAEHRARLKSLSPRQIAMLAKLALIHSEVTEAVEAVLAGDEPLRISEGGKPEGVPAEVADVVIRCLDFCGGYGISASEAVITKHDYNAKRSHKHGGKLA